MNTGFLKHFAADGGLKRFAGFDKACEAGIHAFGPARAAAQQQAVASRDQHDETLS